MILTKQEFEKMSNEEQKKFKLYKNLFKNKFILFNEMTGDSLIFEEGSIR